MNIDLELAQEHVRSSTSSSTPATSHAWTCTYTRTYETIASFALPKQVEDGQERTAYIKASFTFVARGPDNTAAQVPTLKPQTESQQAWFEAGRAGQAARKAFRASSLAHTPPTPDELSIVHRMFMDASAPVQEGAVRASDTSMTTTIICHPQVRCRCSRCGAASELGVICVCLRVHPLSLPCNSGHDLAPL